MKILLLLAIITSIGGCTELGDIIAIHYSIKNSKINLKDLDRDFLPKDTLGHSPNCLTRRSVIDANKWMGLCVNSDGNRITVYRAFRNDLKIEKNGVTKELLESQDFKEMLNITEHIDTILRNKNIVFEKTKPQYMPFEQFQKEYQFTR